MFSYAAQGKGWRLAESLIILASEVARAYPTATCLGTVGDQSHAGEGDQSDHNPFILGPDGIGVVRAIDIGGPADVQQQLFNRLQALYEDHDSRMWPYGYVHKDNVITSWPGPGTHLDPGDVGHLHVSVTQRNGLAPSAGGYVAAIDLTATWGLLGPPSKKADDMTYRLIKAPPPSAGIYAYAPFRGLAVLPNVGYLAVAYSDPDCVTKTDAQIERTDQAHWDYYNALAKINGTVGTA